MRDEDLEEKDHDLLGVLCPPRHDSKMIREMF